MAGRAAEVAAGAACASLEPDMCWLRAVSGANGCRAAIVEGVGSERAVRRDGEVG